MEIMYVKAEIDVEIKNVIEKAIPKLGDKVGLITTAQHLAKIDEAKKILEENGKQVFIGENKKTKNKAEILGCEFSAAESVNNDVDCFLYIGTGRFHPLGVVLSCGKKLIIANPLNGDINEIDKKDIEKMERKKKGALVKFLSSNNIGVLASTKPGQNRIKEALDLKDELKDKNVYVLLSDNLDFKELENFPFIDCFVNTMCYRIGLDDSIRVGKPILNIEDVRHQMGLKK